MFRRALPAIRIFGRRAIGSKETLPANAQRANNAGTPLRGKESIPMAFNGIRFTTGEVRELLSRIIPPDKHTNSREYWLNVVSATCSALGGNESAALVLLKEWQEPWTKNAYESAVRSLRGNYKCTAGTLVFLAFGNDEAAKKVFFRKVYTRGNGENTLSRRPAFTPKPRLCRRSRREEAGFAFLPLSLGKCSIAYPNEYGATTQAPQEFSVEGLVDGIRNGAWKREVEAVRAGTKDKKTLPNVLVFGSHPTGTRAIDLESASGYAIADFDDKGENAGKDFQALREKLLNLPFVASVWKSASGHGLKALVRIPATYLANKQTASKEAAGYILRRFKPFGFWIDLSARATVGTFVSYDENAPSLKSDTQKGAA